MVNHVRTYPRTRRVEMPTASSRLSFDVWPQNFSQTLRNGQSGEKMPQKRVETASSGLSTSSIGHKSLEAFLAQHSGRPGIRQKRESFGGK